MDEQLISKKDLLVECDITYGQLYRWKRKHLIPDEWFIRKSTFTGQEAFLPKEKVLKRIKAIQAYKNDYSLDEMAKMFEEESDSGEPDLLEDDVLIQQWSRYFMNEVGQSLLDQHPKTLAVYVGTILNDVLNKSIVSMDELMDLKAFLLENTEAQPQTMVYICRKLGMTFYMLAEQKAKIQFDQGVKVLDVIDVENLLKKEA